MHLVADHVSSWRGLSYSLIQARVVYDGKIKHLMLGLNTTCLNNAGKD